MLLAVLCVCLCMHLSVCVCVGGWVGVHVYMICFRQQNVLDGLSLWPVYSLSACSLAVLNC